MMGQPKPHLDEVIQIYKKANTKVVKVQEVSSKSGSESETEVANVNRMEADIIRNTMQSVGGSHANGTAATLILRTVPPLS